MFEELERIEQALKVLALRQEAERKKAEDSIKLAYDVMAENRKSTYELINYLAQFLPKT